MLSVRSQNIMLRDQFYTRRRAILPRHFVSCWTNRIFTEPKSWYDLTGIKHRGDDFSPFFPRTGHMTLTFLGSGKYNHLKLILDPSTWSILYQIAAVALWLEIPPCERGVVGSIPSRDRPKPLKNGSSGFPAWRSELWEQHHDWHASVRKMDWLTHYQTTNLRLFQTERVCRRQFQIRRKWQKVIQMGRKHCGKRKNCSLRAISPFPTVFSKGLFPRGVKRCHCVEMG